MPNKLQHYFPMIRTKEVVMAEIEGSQKLKSIFYSWKEEDRQEFIDFCTGARGVKMMYDFMSKEILNPETHRERVNEFLSLLLKQKVKILEVLPNDGTRLADESTLLIMDIVVELEDGSIVNLEIQKIGYMFPGERSACYSSDLLLRQYKRVKQATEKADSRAKLSYKDIKDVYTIVLFQKSPEELKKFENVYMHRFEQHSDTGAKMNLLQKYLFVTLDNFCKIKHNNDNTIKLDNRLEAWLAFLIMDAPEDIVQILEQYPDFKVLYNQVYNTCLNIEEVMGMFSKELLELDRNTVELMIDEMQKQAENLKSECDSMKIECTNLKNEYDSIKNEYDTVKNEYDTVKNEYDTVKNEYDTVKNEYDTVKNEYDTVKNEYDTVKNDYVNTKLENERIKLELEKLRQENAELLNQLT